jgi:Putative Ig domain
MSDAPAQGKAGPAVQVVTRRLPMAMVGKPYDSRLVAEGGTRPYRWILVQGGLPSGLGWSWAGRIAGTPRNDGVFRIIIQAVDNDNNKSGELRFLLIVSAKLRIISDVSLWGDITEPSPNFIAKFDAIGGYPPYIWELEAARGLADMITMDKNDGRITWTNGADILPRKKKWFPLMPKKQLTVKCTDQNGAGYGDTATFVIADRSPRKLWHRG